MRRDSVPGGVVTRVHLKQTKEGATDLKKLSIYKGKWRAQDDDLRTLLGDFVASLK